jgi:predicted choloylglycine hydrolase
LNLTFRWVREERPGPRWLELFERAWPDYRAWFLTEGDAARPDLATCRARLVQHVPELAGVWQRLVELAGGSDEVARMLSLYRPTPYLAGCSQAVRATRGPGSASGGPMLVRNYDYHPAACEAVVALTGWTGTRVLAASDCLWGVLDGMNEHGLVVALSFGGRSVVGDGFGIPLVLRHVLETCATAAQAADALRRIPSHMAYNVSVLDATGATFVAVLAPDRPPVMADACVSTNHQLGSERSRYAALTHSVERERRMLELLADPALSDDALVEHFLEPPLYATQWSRSFGTLYTVVYRPVERTVTFVWPGARVEQSFDAFEERELVVPFGA